MPAYSTPGYYKAEGPMREAGTYTGSQILAKASGGPGVTLSISQSKEVSHSFSCSLPVGVQSISNVVGFTVSASEKINVGGSATVPQYHNGRKVRSMMFTVYPLYQKYTYSVTKVISKRGWTQHIRNVGSGSASQVIGCTFLRSYSYR